MRDKKSEDSVNFDIWNITALCLYNSNTSSLSNYEKNPLSKYHYYNVGLLDVSSL